MEKIIYRVDGRFGTLSYLYLLGLRILSFLTFRKVIPIEKKRNQLEKRYDEKTKIL
ncbi:hypothetical protein ACLM5H_05600 [Fredinandcohnia humi]